MTLPPDIEKQLKSLDTVKRRQLEDYLAEHGEQKLRDQLAAADTRCPSCWAPKDEPHAPVCPNAEVDEAEQPTQDEALF